MITQDLHMHTHLSLCAKKEAVLQKYISQAAEYGIDTVGIADHLWDDAARPVRPEEAWAGFYGPQNMKHILKAREELASEDTHGIRVLFGAEAEFDPVRGDIALTEAAAQQLDFIIVPNSHTHMIMPKAYYEPYGKHAQFMLDVTRKILASPLSKYVTAIAHPFEAVACPYRKSLLYPMISESEYREVFSEAKEKNVAVEINTSTYPKASEVEIRSDPNWEFLSIARDCGCKFTFGTDCHHPDRQKDILTAKTVCEILSLKPENILTL